MRKWLTERAAWHGMMAAYCVTNALKRSAWDEDAGKFLGGTSDEDAVYYGNEAYGLAREAAHFGRLALSIWLVQS